MILFFRMIDYFIDPIPTLIELLCMNKIKFPRFK